MRTVVREVLVVATLLALSTAAALAHTVSLSGRATDPDRAAVAGAAMAGAAVTLTEVSTGRRQTAATAGDGTFRFVDLTPGRYLVDIAAAGFRSHVEDIEVGSSGRTVEASLQVAGISEDVTVRGIATNPTIGRTAVPLRDQPITVNTISAELLQSQGINDLVTALQFVNNVNAYQQYGVYEHYEFRGFADAVQMVDGIRNEGNRVRSQLSNVERIEVLKGPASVLYGSEAIGATMNIVLKQPSSQPAYDGSVSAGSWNTYRGSFGATGRLGSDRTLYRVDTGVESADNFRGDAWTRVNVTPSLMFRVGKADQHVLACPRCGGRLRVIARIEQAAVIDRILRHLGVPTEIPAPHPARAPPRAVGAPNPAGWDDAPPVFNPCS